MESMKKWAGRLVRPVMVMVIFVAGYFVGDDNGYERGLEVANEEVGGECLEKFDEMDVKMSRMQSAETDYWECLNFYWDALATIAIKNEMMGYKPDEQLSIEEVDKILRVQANRR